MARTPGTETRPTPGQRLALGVASLGGVGYIPIASGTWGTLVTIPLYLLLFAGPLWVDIAVLTAVTLLGIAVADTAESLLGKDPGEVVIDESAGFLVTMLLVPPSVFSVALGFFLFRFFDVVKVAPARALERQPGGFGIVADDLVSGFYANLVLQVVLRLLPGAGASLS